MELIGAWLLAPWQKIDALHTFVQCVYCMLFGLGIPKCSRSTGISLHWFERLETFAIFPTVLRLLISSHINELVGWRSKNPRTECDVMAIAQAVRILSSSDPAVAAIARYELKYIVRRSTQSEPTPELLSTYLSSTPNRRMAKLYYTYSSLWSRVRQACRRFRVSFHYLETTDVTISADDSEHIKSNQVITFLHRLVQSRFGNDLMNPTI